MLEYPVKMSEIPAFEKRNNLKINVYGYTYILADNKYVIHPLQISKYRINNVNRVDEQKTTSLQRSCNEIDLLLVTSKIKGNFNTHYCAISSLSRLVSSQLSKHDHKSYICRSCLTAFTTEDKLTQHKTLCAAINDDVTTKMPTDIQIEFKNFKNQIPIGFVGYADFECSLEKISVASGSKSTKKQSHTVTGWSFQLVCTEDANQSLPLKTYTGPDAVKVFLNYIKQVEGYVFDTKYANPVKIIINAEQECEFQKATTCYLCNGDFKEDITKARDHCHITGVYRGPTQIICNLDARIPHILCRSYFIICAVMTRTLSFENWGSIQAKLNASRIIRKNISALALIVYASSTQYNLWRHHSIV